MDKELDNLKDEVNLFLYNEFNMGISELIISNHIFDNLKYILKD